MRSLITLNDLACEKRLRDPYADWGVKDMAYVLDRNKHPEGSISQRAKKLHGDIQKALNEMFSEDELEDIFKEIEP
jgi:hypothetical protein